MHLHPGSHILSASGAQTADYQGATSHMLIGIWHVHVRCRVWTYGHIAHGGIQ